MKISKRVLVPVALLVVIGCILGIINLKNSNYLLCGIKNSEIKAMTIYHNGNSVIRTVHNNDGKKLLKLLNKSIKNDNFDPKDGSFIYDGLLSSLASGNSEDYYVEIPFIKTEKLDLNGTSIDCDLVVLDINEKVLLYHSPDGYSLKRLSITGSDFDKLQKFLSSKYK